MKGLLEPVRAANEYESSFRRQIRGEEPRPEPQRSAPGPTHTTPLNCLETNQRMPYLPAEKIAEPSLEDGVAMRQKLY